jgi:hypothetical protein
MSLDTCLSETTLGVALSARPQPYRHIHKGLRVLLTHTLQRAGALDADDAAERAALVRELELLLTVCTDHLAHENHFFHEPLRRRAPRAVLAFDEDHREHLGAIAHLRLHLQRVRDAGDHPGADAAALAYALYLDLSRFVAENLAHMAEEEATLTRALWQHFGDDEIRRLEDALHATLSPDESAFYLRWMARGLNVAELHALLADARAAAPAAVFDGLLDIATAELGTDRRARLLRALGLPAVPGLVA